MRIVISSDIYPPVVSGVSTVVDKQSRMLAARGHEVVVIAPGYPPYTLIPISKNLSHYTIWALPNVLRDNSYIGYVPAFHVKTMLSQFKPDLVHFHSIGPVGYSTLKAARQLGIPTIGTMHGIPQFITSYAPWLTKTSKRIMHRMLWWFVRNFYNKMDRITTPSRFASEQMLRHTITTPITVIPMWIDPLSVPKHTHTILSKYSIPENKHIFIYVGRIDLDKNLSVILHAAARLLQKSDAFHIVFAGKGAHTTHLKQLASRLSLSHMVTFTGYISETDKIKLYKQAHAFIMPSPVETQSLTTLEALQSGLPLILANAGALPEIAEKFPHHTFLFVHKSPTDLAKILEGSFIPRTRRSITKAFIKKYGKQEHIHSLEVLYRTLMS